MNNKIIKLLAERFSAIHPFWPEQGCYNYAESFYKSLTPELSAVAEKWALTGEETDYSYEKYSVFSIMQIAGRDYPDAIDLMNEYIKDPIKGEMAIFPY